MLPPNNNNNSNGTQNQLNSNIARILSAAGASEIQQCNQKFNNTNNNYGRSSVGNSTFVYFIYLVFCVFTILIFLGGQLSLAEKVQQKGNFES